MTTVREWRVRLPYRTPPLTLNTRTHWSDRYRIEQRIHRDMITLARANQLPTGLTKIRVQLGYTPRDNRRRDNDNLTATAKPLYDALTKPNKVNKTGHGMVPDDTPEYMEKPAPVITAADPKDPHLWVVITDLSGDHHDGI